MVDGRGDGALRRVEVGVGVGVGVSGSREKGLLASSFVATVVRFAIYRYVTIIVIASWGYRPFVTSEAIASTIIVFPAPPGPYSITAFRLCSGFKDAFS